MIRRLVLVWLATLILVVAVGVVSGNGLGLRVQKSEVIDERLPTVAGCFGTKEGESVEWNRQLCTFGPTSAVGDLLIVGDSTVASMADGLYRAALKRNLRVVVYPSRGCTFTTRYPYSYTWCSSYFKSSIELLKDVKPVGLIVSNYLSRMDLPDRRIPTLENVLPESRDARLLSTVLSFEEAVREVRTINPELPILIVHEIPVISVMKPSLLFDRSTNLTIQLQQRSYQRQREYIKTVESVLQKFDGLSYLDTAKTFCDSTRCSARDKTGIVLYMDSYHLNPSGSFLLEDEFSYWFSTELDLP